MRFLIARHGETVFNVAGRIQGEHPHTPLTRTGFAQADEIGAALRDRFGARPDLELWASPTGRALQTLAVIVEHLELDWHQARTDPRLREIDVGEWGGRFYREIEARSGGFVDREAGLFTFRPPGGEWYDDIAVRLQAWLDDHAEDRRDRLIVMHGISSRVLRGLLTGAAHHGECHAPVAASLPQGSMVEIVDGTETVLHRGGGGHGVSRPAGPA